MFSGIGWQAAARAARQPRAEEGGADDLNVGARLVFDQHFSVAPVRTTRAELRIEVVDDAKKLRRGFAALPLPALGDQKQQALDLELARPGGQGGRPAFLRATAQFQYSKVVPIKAEITAKLEEQRRLHRVARVELEGQARQPRVVRLGGAPQADGDARGVHRVLQQL